METLRTERLDLVPLDPERDAVELHAMLGDPEVHPYSAEDASRDVAETRARLEKDLAGNGEMTWAIRLRPDERALGTIGLFYDQGTPIRGLSWSLRRDHWGRGITGEAAPVVVEHLLAQPGIDGVEAWIDTRNTRSIGVARRAALDEVSRFPRVYADHVAQQVVMARAAEPRDPDVVAVRPVLQVSDAVTTARLLSDVLGMRVQFTYGEPVTFVRLSTTAWSGSGGIDLAQDTTAPATIVVEVGFATDACYRRALAAGAKVNGPPEDMPWGRREFGLLLADGHLVRVSGP